MKRFNKNKFIKLALIPLGLAFLWLVLTVYYIITFDTSLTVLSFSHGRESFNNINYNKLLKGDKVSGEFTAAENNLGIVSIKFQTFIRPPYADEDHLIFRLKEKGAKNWYYENTYRDGLVYDVPIFPFGFPKIANSQGKTYQFEIESLSGNAENSVALSDRDQILFSKYQMSKSVLLHDKKELAIFTAKKFINAFSTTDVRFSSFIYLLPFLFYLLWISPFGKKYMNPLFLKLKNFFFPVNAFKYLPKYYLNWIMVIIVVFDIFVVQLNNDIVYLVMIGLWIGTFRAYKLDSKTTFIFALILLLIPPIFLAFRDEPTAEKAAIWAYMFLVAGTIQAMLELKSVREIHEKS